MKIEAKIFKIQLVFRHNISYQHDANRENHFEICYHFSAKMNADLAAVFFSLVLGISVDWIQGETRLVRLELNTIALVGLYRKITLALDAVNMLTGLRRIKLRMFVRRYRSRCSFFETHFRAKFRCFVLLTVTTVSESSFRFMSMQKF